MVLEGGTLSYERSTPVHQQDEETFITTNTDGMYAPREGPCTFWALLQNRWATHRPYM